MPTTSLSLLQRLQQPAAEADWNRFVQLYTPLLHYWAWRVGLRAEEAADLVQDVLLLLVKKLPEFRYEAQGSFRGWLRTVTLNKWRERRRQQSSAMSCTNIDGVLADLVTPDGVTLFNDGEYREFLVRRAFDLAKDKLEPTTWRACWSLFSGKSTAAVAAELNMTEPAVRAAKFRTLQLLRRELKGLLE